MTNFNWSWRYSSLNRQSMPSSILVGHGVSDITLRANANLYAGIRRGTVFFNSQYFFFNYVLKGNMLKKICSSGADFFFTTPRLEFFFEVKKFANKCGVPTVRYDGYGSLTAALHKVSGAGYNSRAEPQLFTSPVDPVIFLFNNDLKNSKVIMRELVEKNYYTISAADSNSINTAGGGCPALYGNDDSVESIHFFGNFIHSCIKGAGGKNNNCVREDVKPAAKKKKRISSLNEDFIIKLILKKKIKNDTYN